jgi:hypothetical protein
VCVKQWRLSLRAPRLNCSRAAFVRGTCARSLSFAAVLRITSLQNLRLNNQLILDSKQGNSVFSTAIVSSLSSLRLLTSARSHILTHSRVMTPQLSSSFFSLSALSSVTPVFP